MKKYIIILSLVFGLFSCGEKLNKLGEENPYIDGVKKVNIQLKYPDDYSQMLRAGVKVKINNPANGVEYVVEVDNSGKASIDLQYGLYRLSVSDKGVSDKGVIPLFNKNIDQLRITDTIKGAVNVDMDMTLSFSSQIIFKELYYMGCMGSDGKGYQYDKYVQLYNNSSSVAYLDSLCFGCLDSYNAPTSFTPWSYYDASGQRTIRDTIPVIEAIWQFPGSGKDFPLNPGEDVVVALCGAIDHTIINPQSVNLNVSGYFVCYNQKYTNTTFHPSPGANLSGHILNLIWKESAANAYPFSMSSPAPVIFNIRGVSAQDYVNNPDNLKKRPGSSSQTRYTMIPSSWVLDGVDVVDATTKYKRFPTSIDASSALLLNAEKYKGKTLHRKVDEQASKEAGMTVYMDTNNSAEDFEVRNSQSIKK